MQSLNDSTSNFYSSYCELIDSKINVFRISYLHVVFNHNMSTKRKRLLTLIYVETSVTVNLKFIYTLERSIEGEVIGFKIELYILIKN